MKIENINKVSFNLTNIAKVWVEKGEKKFKEYATGKFWPHEDAETEKRWIDELWLEVLAVAPKKK